MMVLKYHWGPLLVALTFFFWFMTGTWYIGVQGKDTLNCGTSYKNACFTLSYLLKRSYSETHSPVAQIITDKDLVINKNLVVSEKFGEINNLILDL